MLNEFYCIGSVNGVFQLYSFAVLFSVMFNTFMYIFFKRTITPDSQGLSKPCSQVEPVTVLSKDFSRTVNPVSLTTDYML